MDACGVGQWMGLTWVGSSLRVSGCAKPTRKTGTAIMTGIRKVQLTGRFSILLEEGINGHREFRARLRGDPPKPVQMTNR